MEKQKTQDSQHNIEKKEPDQRTNTTRLHNFLDIYSDQGHIDIGKETI